ncbi:Peptidyl-tRNA hydrolase 2, mitochondrial [Oopsacas minuta]|uniref:peptidyl-tRNA hydrolase n=1 Tax=Oopsacas minuta TaxID=111878 RepID=A0AAV7K0G6_9METZ|nr:Peptidyl-tRNA hydrolase 2, mitochondrial [Oopsacas minuta]
MNLIIALSAGVCIGFLAAHIKKPSIQNIVKSKDKNPTAYTDDNTGDYKMVLVVRNDLHMGKGKAAAQCAHGATSTYHSLIEEHQYQLIERWMDCGQKKVVVKVESLEEMQNIKEKAMSFGLHTESIRDAGHTQLAPGTTTVLAIGPDHSKQIDEITGHLKLY